METLMTKLDDLVKRRFPGAMTELDPFDPPSRVGGLIVWKGFAGVDPELRVKKVYDAIKEELKPAEMKRIAILMPLTPEEMTIRKQELTRDERGTNRSVVGS